MDEETVETVEHRSTPNFRTPASASVDAPQKNVRPIRCPCGAPLTQLPAGRPRLTCCRWCKRRRDGARRMIAVRRRWIAAWRLEATIGGVSLSEADVEVALLEDDIRELSRTVEFPEGETTGEETAVGDTRRRIR